VHRDGSRDRLSFDPIETLRAFSLHLSSGPAPDDLPDVVVEWAQQLVPCTAAAITWIDSETGRITQAAAVGAAFATPVHPFNDHQTLSEWVAQYRRALRLDDMRSATFADGRSIGAYLALPLHAGDQVFGVLELVDVQPGRFGEQEERLLTILAAQAAQALASAQRYAADDEHLQTHLVQLRSLQRISRELTSTLYLHNILDFALKEALRATRATHGYVALRGYTVEREAFEMEQSDAISVAITPQTYIVLRSVGENGPVRLIVAGGYSIEEEGRLINVALDGGRTIAEEVIASGEARVIDHLAHDDRPALIGPFPLGNAGSADLLRRAGSRCH